MDEDRIKKICKAMVEKAYAKVEVDTRDDSFGYELAVREFCNLLGVDDAEITYITMNTSTCSRECLERIAYQPVIERI